ncbi:MAG: DEAD/DEAH box helicase [Spirochaeta sp.]|nr:DEAD/DEAH box helicase [Spirochaeta sp.]
MNVNQDLETITRDLNGWTFFARELRMNRLLAGPGQRDKAEQLHYRRACTISTVDENRIVAAVDGDTGSYTVTLDYADGDLHSRCTCPSPYVPCKHVGAVLFGLMEDPFLIFPRGSALIQERDGATAAVDRAGPPGHTETDDSAEDGERWLSRFAGAPKSMYQLPTVDPRARYRPAFRLAAASFSGDLLRASLMVEPVLVYLRQDGEDGRLDPCGGNRTRLPGNAATERLLALLQSVPLRRLPALPLLGADLLRGEMSPGGEMELYLDRAERLERERRVHFRPIMALRVRWRIDPLHAAPLRYQMEVELDDGEAPREVVDHETSEVDWDGTSLWAVRRESGTVWYLPDAPSLPEDTGQRRRLVAVVAGLLTDGSPKGREEARAIAFAAERHPLVAVEPLPEEVARAVGTPVAVVRLQERRGLQPPHPVSIHLSFRYGSVEVDLGSPVALVPDDGETVGTDEGVGDRGQDRPADGPADTSNGRAYLLRDTTREEAFLAQLGSAVTQASEKQDARITAQLEYRQYRETFPITMQSVLLYTAPALLDAGFEILVDKKRVYGRAPVPRYRVVESGEDWLMVEPGLLDGDQFLPLESDAGLAGGNLLQAGGRYYLVTSGADVRALSRTLGRERISTRDLWGLGEIEEHLIDQDHPALVRYRELRERLSRFERLEAVTVPASFHGTLRPYQEHGLAWLWFLHTTELGGCLADDMGLGKTIQTLALLALAREAGEMRRALIVAPVSTLGNWMDETSRFTPDLQPHLHAGPDRHQAADELSRADVIFVSYEILLRDRDALAALEPDYLILDEAQAIKNPRSKRRTAAAAIPAPHRLALSGTPVENGVSELWSLMDVVAPGILGSHSAFRHRFSGVETEDSAARERLRATVRPLILRRTKAAVAPDLPPKEEILLRADAGTRQARFYEELRAYWEGQVHGALGNPKEQFRILEAMLRLRQAAILPALVDPRHHELPSAKLDLLMERLGQIHSEGNKAIIFSQFLGVLDEVERRLLGGHGTPWKAEAIYRLEGSTPQRERSALIKGFQSTDGAAIFLISLKAGGTGINLTAADYVFLMDPWWNPAVEAQAVDRAHRIGRHGAVIAYRVITGGTIEEKMVRLQEKKRSLADALVSEESAGLRELSQEDISALFAHDGD